MKARISTVALVLAMTWIGVAQSDKRNDSPSKATRQERRTRADLVSEQRAVAEIAITLERNKTVVPVTAGGASLRLILDSGYPNDGILLFHPGKVDTDVFGPSFAGTIPGGGSGSGSGARVFDAASFSVGSAAFRNQRVIALTGDTFNGFTTDGVIGYSLFGHYVVELDYDQNVMRLYDSGTFTVRAGWESLPIYFKSNRIPWVDVTVSTEGEPPVRLATYIDSASSEALELLTRDVNKFRPPTNTRERLLGRGLSGDIYGREGRIAKLGLGSHELANVLVATAPATVRSKQPDADAVLANNVLRRFNVIFDYAHQKLHLRPNSHFSEPF